MLNRIEADTAENPSRTHREQANTKHPSASPPFSNAIAKDLARTGHRKTETAESLAKSKIHLPASTLFRVEDFCPHRNAAPKFPTKHCLNPGNPLSKFETHAKGKLFYDKHRDCLGNRERIDSLLPPFLESRQSETSGGPVAAWFWLNQTINHSPPLVLRQRLARRWF